MGTHIAVFTCRLFGGFHELQHRWVLHEVRIHVTLRGTAADVKVVGQAKCTHAINQTEVNHFCHAPLVKADILQFNTKNLRCGALVNVFVV